MSSAAEPEAGQLYVVRCEPDPFTAERLNVGVFGVDRAGRRLARTIQQPGRLECLYGEAAQNVVWLARAAEQCALAGAAPASPQISFDGPMPFRNQTLEQAVERAFAELVTVALPLRTATGAGSSKVTDEDAQRSVGDALKQIIGLDFEIMANTPQVVLQTERGPWTVHIPLQPRQGVGTIRSTEYTPATLKSHLLDSVLDLECAARYRSKRSLGLFLLRPQRAGSVGAAAIDEVIDSVNHRAPAALHLEVSDTAEALAHHIKRWASSAAA